MKYDYEEVKKLINREYGWVERKQIDNPYYSVLDERGILGSNDASIEWREDDEKASSQYVLIDAYNEFKKPDRWILYGRRGTGKSALLRYLRHSIRLNKIDKYNLCWLVASEYVQFSINQALESFGKEDDSRVIRYISEIWKWIFEVSLITCIYFEHKYQSNIDFDFNLNEINHLDLFFSELDIDTSTKNWHFKNKVGDRILKCVYDIPRFSEVGHKWNLLVKSLKTERHKSALEIIKKQVTKNDLFTLILIDSPDTFKPYQSVIFSALLTAIVETDEREYQNKYMVNATVPSEMVPYLSNQLHPDRIGEHELYLRWTYKKLLLFIARRFASYLGKNPREISDWKTANVFLDKCFPANVSTKNNIKLRTWSYIIRHTMKTPRQLLMLCNCILTIAERRNLMLNDLLSEENNRIINWGVHARLDKLLNAITHISLQIDADFHGIAWNTLTLNNAYFTASQLDIYMKGNERFNKGVFNTTDLQRNAMINSGLLGVLREVHKLKNNQYYFISSFEYQVKDILHPSDRDIFVVHPICYETLRMNLLPEIIVYPYPYEDEEQFDLNRIGVNLT